MKKIIMLLLSIVVFDSCKEKSNFESSNYASCQILKPDFESTISMNQFQLPFDFWQGASKSIKDESYFLGFSNQNENLTQTDIVNILNHFKFPNITDISKSQTITCVFFSSTDYSNNPTAQLSFDDLLGISIYFVENYHLKVSVFKKGIDDFICLNELTSQASKLPVLDFYKTALILKDKNKDISALVVSPKSVETKQLKRIMENSENSFSHKLSLYLDKSSTLTTGSSSPHLEEIHTTGGGESFLRKAYFLLPE